METAWPMRPQVSKKWWSWAFVWLRSIYFLKAGDLPRLKPFPQFFYAEKSSPQTFTLLESMLRSNGFKNIYVVPLWFPFFNPGCSSSQPAQHGWGNPKFGGWEVSRFRSRIEFVFLPKVKSLQKEKMRQRMIVHKVKHLLWAAKKRHDFSANFDGGLFLQVGGFAMLQDMLGKEVLPKYYTLWSKNIDLMYIGVLMIPNKFAKNST